MGAVGKCFNLKDAMLSRRGVCATNDGPVGAGVRCNVLSLTDFSLESLTPRRPPFRGPLRDLFAELRLGGFALRLFICFCLSLKGLLYR
ncbi:hypothetical protein QQF64_004151 [Cirrhinus molitorella]|uniref:Uncharacterized protein n=1 Tax=Cirrhinus molitorella TaxID=172907 RepID=A0ABR3MFF0_9TELE